MKLYSRKFTPQYPLSIAPMGEIAGYLVRPGMFDINGAYALRWESTSPYIPMRALPVSCFCFNRYEEEPYAVIPFPEEYKIGDVYSMIVFGLDIEEFEYAYRVDGPLGAEKGASL